MNTQHRKYSMETSDFVFNQTNVYVSICFAFSQKMITSWKTNKITYILNVITESQTLQISFWFQIPHNAFFDFPYLMGAIPVMGPSYMGPLSKPGGASPFIGPGSPRRRRRAKRPSHLSNPRPLTRFKEKRGLFVKIIFKRKNIFGVRHPKAEYLQKVSLPSAPAANLNHTKTFVFLNYCL